METYNQKLCATYDDLIGIVNPDTIRQSVVRGKIEQVRVGGNGREALFAVESLPLKYRTEVYHRYPDMKAQAQSKPFIDAIEPDGAALSFFETYKLSDGRNLATDKQTEYSNNAAILNAFRSRLELSNSHRTRQSHRRINKAEFWNLAAQALPRLGDLYPNTLPAHPRRLQEKFNQYQSEGYDALVTGKFGIRNAAKVVNDQQQSVIAALLSDHRNLDNAQIANVYGSVAQQMGWETLTPSAIAVWRTKYELTTSSGRLGAPNFHNTKAMQHKRTKPTAPLLFWTLDGWDVELYYQKTEENKRGHNVTTYHHRLTVVVVLDPCENYPIGYAIGEQEEPKLIKAALRDAANHTAVLFGQRYRANQLQSDHYAIKTMSPIYDVVSAKVTPARVKNAKSKVIEPYFGRLNKTYCQYMPNWSGFGITSNKYKQPNADALNSKRKQFPDYDGCVAQITHFMEIERQSRREAYIKSWSKLPDDRKLPLTDEQYLLNFGAITGHKNALEGSGLLPRIEGVKRAYDCFDPKFREYAHLRWTVMYDPDNLDRVLAVNDEGTLRFMLESKYIQPMALADRKEGDVEQLSRVDNFNKQLVESIANKQAAISSSCKQLVLDNPQLGNSLAKVLLVDSRGQHKDQRNKRRLRNVVDVESIEVNVVGDTKTIDMGFEVENTVDLY